MKTNVPPDLVSVGHIIGAYGVQGWVRIHPYSVDASALLHAKTWWLVRNEHESQADDVERLEVKRHGEGVVARIIGINGRDAAESLKGAVVHIQRSHFPVLSDNEFYWLDLIGSAVENCQGERLGEVIDLIDNGAHPILRVAQCPNAHKNACQNESPKESEKKPREYLIPFVDHFVPSVDQKNKKIIVDWGVDYE